MPASIAQFPIHHPPSLYHPSSLRYLYNFNFDFSTNITMDSANMSCPSFNASVPSVASNSSIVAVPSTAGPGFPHSIIPAQSSMSNAGQQINNATGAWVIPQSNVDYQGPITDLEAWNHGFYSRRRPNWRLAPSLANISYIRSLALPLYIAIQQTADVCDQLQKKSGKPATAVIWMQKKVWKEEDIWLVSWKLAVSSYSIFRRCFMLT